MRGLGFLLVAAVLTTSGVAEAQRARAAADQKTTRYESDTKSKPTKSDTAAAKRKTTRRNPPAKAKPTAEAGIPTNALLVQYQRVGRELMLLTNVRAAKIGVEGHDAKVSCAELQAMFRSIKLSEAVATPESRADATALLADIHAKIVRLRGVTLTQACLDNPLAKDCT